MNTKTIRYFEQFLVQANFKDIFKLQWKNRWLCNECVNRNEYFFLISTAFLPLNIFILLPFFLYSNFFFYFYFSLEIFCNRLFFYFCRLCFSLRFFLFCIRLFFRLLLTLFFCSPQVQFIEIIRRTLFLRQEKIRTFPFSVLFFVWKMSSQQNSTYFISNIWEWKNINWAEVNPKRKLPKLSNKRLFNLVRFDKFLTLIWSIMTWKSIQGNASNFPIAFLDRSIPNRWIERSISNI